MRMQWEHPTLTKEKKGREGETTLITKKEGKKKERKKERKERKKETLKTPSESFDSFEP